MEPSENPCGGVGQGSDRGRARRRPRSVPDEAELPAANHTKPVQVMPCQIQTVFKSDPQGRRYMVLENLPVDKNYVANVINTGGEFAIGGTPAFICDALASELEAREVQDSREHRRQSWHIIALPDSNMSNQTISYFYQGSETTDQYPMATKVRPIQQSLQGNQQDLGLQQNPQAIQTAVTPQMRPLYDQQADFVQQSPYNGQQVAVPDQNFFGNQQPISGANSAISGFGGGYSSVPQSQQLRLTTPMLGNFSEGSGSTAMFPQGQSYSQIQQQGGSHPGFGLSSGPAQGSYQGQGNNMIFGPNDGFPMEPLPQAHRPIFDRFGFIVGEQACTTDGGMYGGNLYSDEMNRAGVYNDFGYPRPHQFQGPQQRFDDSQQAQATNMGRDPQLVDAQSFYNFVANTMDGNEIDQEERDQQEDNQEEGHQEEDDLEEDDLEEDDPEDGDSEDGDREDYESEDGDPEDSDPEEGDPEGDEQDEDYRIDNDQEHTGAEEGKTQDKGTAKGSSSRTNTNSSNSPHRPPSQRPEVPPADVLWARERSPHRFQDRTGMGLCDYCDRPGHEAEACLRWDPDHYDKPVCTACNNKEHSLDECPKFRAMAIAEKRALLVGKGAGRPGVRSQYHAWTRYVGHGHGATGIPLTRRFLKDLSNSTLGSDGGGGSDIWEDWDYDQGIPDHFRDLVAEVLAADQPGLVDERFMSGNHGFRRNAQPGASL